MRTHRMAAAFAGAMKSLCRRAYHAASFWDRWRGLAHFRRFRGAGDDRAGALEGPPRRALTWPSRLLLVAALAVPLLLLTIAAWQNYRLVQLEAEQRVNVETGQLHEHAVSAIETYALILAWI